MPKQVGITVIVVLAAQLSACASIINGRTQSVGISSSPAGARALVNPVGTTVITPSQVELRRNTSYTILVEKDGYEPGSATVSSGPSAWLLGNILIGGLIGLAVDFITGGAWKLTPETVSVALLPKLQPPNPVPEAEAIQPAPATPTPPLPE